MFSVYNFFITTKLRSLNLFNCLEIAEKYEKVHQDPKEVFDEDGNLIDNESEKIEPVFVSVKDEEGNDSCVVFYDNLFILFSMNNELKDKIVQIYIKRPEDEWHVPTKENGLGLDLLNPDNIKMEVYVNYDVSVLKLNRRLSRCMGEEYTSGKWDKIFYKTLNSFLVKVGGYTDLNQVSVAYGK